MVGSTSFWRFFFGFIGLVLSVYSLMVEFSIHDNKDYKPMCDISEVVSCSKVFMSKYGTGFGIVEPLLGKSSPLNVPNTIYGIVFYQIIIILGFMRKQLWAVKLLLILSIMSCFMNVYLGYILYIMQDICVVCISTYFVNIVLMYLNAKEYIHFAPEARAKSD